MDKQFIQKFKEGAMKPESIQTAKLFFLFFIVFGFFLGGIQSFVSGSLGLGIALVALSGLQSISFFMELKAYKVLKETKKAFEIMSNENKEMEELI